MPKNEYGKWAFLLGILLSIGAVFFEFPMAVLLIAIIGIVVAMVNIQAKEDTTMLLWVLGLGVVGLGSLATSLTLIPTFGEMVAGIIVNIGAFFTVISATFLTTIGWKKLSS